jgi:hypothetical protein
MARPRITFARSNDGILEIWMNPEGREKLVKELEMLRPDWDHAHIGWDMDIDADPIPYRPEDEVLEWGKIYMRLDEWDEKFFPHVMAEKSVLSWLPPSGCVLIPPCPE